jgi:hypothetical protein
MAHHGFCFKWLTLDAIIKHSGSADRGRSDGAPGQTALDSTQLLGLVSRISQRRFYYNTELGPFIGRQVFAWFNIEQPDLLTVSDLEMKTFVSVKRPVLSAFDASKEQLSRYP